MKNSVFKWLLVGLICGCAGWNVAQPQIRYLPADGLLDITPYVAYLADSTEKLTIDQVQRLSSAAFKPNNKAGLSLGSTHLPYWFRIDFADTTYAEDLYFYSDFPLHYLDIYLTDTKDGHKHWQTGVLRPFGGRDFQTNKYIINLGKHPRQVFWRAQSPTLHLPIAIATIRPLVNYTHLFDLWTGGLLALVATLAVYNLFLFFALQDRVFLYYAAYQLSLFYLVIHGIGIAHQFFFPNNPVLNADNNTGVVVSVGLTLLFVSKFLNLSVLAPYLRWWLFGIFGLLVGLAVCEWTLPYRAWQNDLTNALVVVHACSVIGAGLYVWRLGYQPAKYFTLASIC
jgi:two-component system, sensor histidine kinase LadS